jgi:hypothetical protein
MLGLSPFRSGPDPNHGQPRGVSIVIGASLAGEVTRVFALIAARLRTIVHGSDDPQAKRTLDDRLRAVILGQYNLLSRAPRATMRRRKFITFVGFSAVARPIGALAQQTSKIWRVGILETTSETLNAPNVNAFRRGLRARLRRGAKPRH